MALKKKLNIGKIINFIKKKNIQLIIQLVLTVVILFNIGSTLLSVKQYYINFDYWDRFSSLENAYRQSQYVNKHPTGWIPDETALAYAGGKLITGTNPVLVISDAPPLGKYLIGASALIFNNENIVILITSLLSLYLLYLLGLQVFSSKTYALLSPFALSFESIFKNQLIYTPLLDMIQLVFILSSFIFFNKGLISKKSGLIYFVLANILLGCFMGTKFFITGLTVIFAWFLILIIHKKGKKILSLIITIPISFIILLLSYVRVFAFGYSLRSFLGIQKWIFLYHKSQLILPFSIWPLILFNKWYVWWGDEPIINDPQWQITWPIITIITILTILIYIFKKIERKKEIEVLMAWSVIYFAFFSFGQITSRYFVILIPILYVISLYGIVRFIVALDKKTKLSKK